MKIPTWTELQDKAELNPLESFIDQYATGNDIVSRAEWHGALYEAAKWIVLQERQRILDQIKNAFWNG